MNFKSALLWVVAYFDDLISKNAGSGRSVQSFVYLFAAAGAVFSSIAMTVAAAAVGIYAAVAPLIAGLLGRSCPAVPLDAVFWGAYFACLTGLWAAAFGFITSAKKNSTNATKEITLAGMPAAPAAPAPAVVTETSVTASKTTTAPAAPGAQRAPRRRGDPPGPTGS